MTNPILAKAIEAGAKEREKGHLLAEPWYKLDQRFAEGVAEVLREEYVKEGREAAAREIMQWREERMAAGVWLPGLARAVAIARGEAP